MKIALDAMGGDFAPANIVQGAIEAINQHKIKVILVGIEEKIRAELQKYKYDESLVSVVHASEVIAMDESPAKAVRRKTDSSINVAIKLVKDKKAEGFVSAGNTGAVVSASLIGLGRLKDISRPAIATLLPTLTGMCIMLDVGATVDCKPRQLAEFAVMGEAYARYILDIENPRVGVLSVGEEDSKGNEVSKLTRELLAKMPLNFVGNVEGRDVTKGIVDVTVCDGFIGNAMLKFGEGLGEMIFTLLKSEIQRGILSKIGLLFLSSALRNFKKRVDYSEYGGAPLLGLKEPVTICHGGSSAKAIKNALLVAEKFAQQKVNEHIKENVHAYFSTEEEIS